MTRAPATRYLVSYASHFGQTRRIAYRVADRLRARGHEVELATVQDGPHAVPPPEDYDAVVLGSRVEFGRHAAPLLAWIRDNLAALRTMPTAFFSVSGAAAHAGASADPNGYLAATFDDLGWRPTRAVAFGGALPYRRYGLLLRVVMKLIARSNGHPTDTSRDHDLTSWSAVDRWADELDGLRTSPPPAPWREPDPARVAPGPRAR